MDSFVSYAQNFEDVMLWRALKHIEKGFYVDVGANDPKIDSVTYAFYERGWRGINIEPIQSFYQRQCDERPRDINLHFAIGAREEELVLFEVSETGLSTVDSAIAKSHRDNGWNVIERKVHALTLNQVLSEYVHGPIHFLKIDVEGFEGAVLQGLDLSQWRPWILVIEAMMPNSTQKNYENWEPLVLSAAYIFAYFDGLNRFYVANEHAELIESFAVPPNYFDHFTSVHQLNLKKQVEWQASILQENKALQSITKRELEAAKKEVDTLRTELDWARGEIGHLRTEMAYLRNEVERGRKELEKAYDERNSLRTQLEGIRSELESKQSLLGKIQDELKRARSELGNALAELDSKRAEADNFRKEYLNVYFSRSYQITAPLRAFYGFSSAQQDRVRRLVNRFLGKREAAFASTETAAFIPELSQDEKHFLDLFQREIAKRSLQIKGEQ